MNKDVFQGKWHQLKGRVKQQWGKLTDDDLQRIEGDVEQAAGLLQERYGYTKELAKREWDQFCDTCNKAQKVTDKGERSVTFDE